MMLPKLLGNIFVPCIAYGFYGWIIKVQLTGDEGCRLHGFAVKAEDAIQGLAPFFKVLEQGIENQVFVG